MVNGLVTQKESVMIAVRTAVTGGYKVTVIVNGVEQIVKKKTKHPYQFVGVNVHTNEKGETITWYTCHKKAPALSWLIQQVVPVL